MQKKLIALAIAGLASTAAFAQSNVTIYGVVDASVDFTNAGDGAAGSGVRTNKISSNVSRIGFKGTEDLGDGLKAIFQLETAFNADGTATTNLNGRNTYVGLASSNWGQVLLGQYDTPYKTSTRGLDFFADHLGDNRNLMGAGLVAFDGRPANTIRFDSVDYSGFKFAVAYVAGAEATVVSGTDKGRALSANVTYENGPWYGTLAHERHTFGAAGTGTFATGTGDVEEHATKFGVGYKEGAIRVGFSYEHTDDDFVATLAHNAWTLGGGYTFGANEVKLAYTKANQIDGTSSSGAKQWALGIDHILSKRTKVYAEYTKLTNESGVKYGLTGAGGNNTAGTAANGFDADPSAFQFGVKHSF